MQIHAGPVYTVYSVGVRMWIRPVLFRRRDSLVSSIPSSSYLFLFPFPAGFSGPQGRDLIEISYLGLSV